MNLRNLDKKMLEVVVVDLIEEEEVEEDLIIILEEVVVGSVILLVEEVDVAEIVHMADKAVVFKSSAVEVPIIESVALHRIKKLNSRISSKRVFK